MIHFNNLIQLLNKFNYTHSSPCGDLKMLDTNTPYFTVRIFILKHGNNITLKTYIHLYSMGLIWIDFS